MSSHVNFVIPPQLEISKLWHRKLKAGIRHRFAITRFNVAFDVCLYITLHWHDSHHNYLLCFVLEILLGGKQRKQSFRTERLAESWQTGDRKFTDDEKSTQRSEIGRDSYGSCLKWPNNWFHSW